MGSGSGVEPSSATLLNNSGIFPILTFLCIGSDYCAGSY
jgi:hypothetical protein